MSHNSIRRCVRSLVRPLVRNLFFGGQKQRRRMTYAVYPALLKDLPSLVEWNFAFARLFVNRPSHRRNSFHEDESLSDDNDPLVDVNGWKTTLHGQREKQPHDSPITIYSSPSAARTAPLSKWRNSASWTMYRCAILSSLSQGTLRSVLRGVGISSRDGNSRIR